MVLSWGLTLSIYLRTEALSWGLISRISLKIILISSPIKLYKIIINEMAVSLTSLLGWYNEGIHKYLKISIPISKLSIFAYYITHKTICRRANKTLAGYLSGGI